MNETRPSKNNLQETVISYLKYSGAGLIASAADNLTFFLLNHFGVPDQFSLIGARIVSLIVNFILLQFAVFKDSKRPDSFPRYVVLVIFSTTIVYFAMKVLEPIIPINPTFIKMGVEFLMNFLNYYLAKKFVFNGSKPEEEAHEA